MSPSSDDLARSITRSANRQADATIRLLADRQRKSDAYRAYGYFRWVDDRLDQERLDRSLARSFLARQQALVDAAFQGRPLASEEPEEDLLLELISADPRPDSGLALYIRHMMEVMGFDAERRGRVITAAELTGYTRSLATAVTEALHYFIGGSGGSSSSPDRYLAVAGAHIAHMLRDTREDVACGYFNIPSELLQSAGISPEQMDSPAYRDWVRDRVELARRCLRRGRGYLVGADSLRFRIAGLAYCVRFERCLDSIERDDYLLQPGLVSDRRGTGHRTALLTAVAAALLCRPRSASTAGARSPSRSEDAVGAGPA